MPPCYDIYGLSKQRNRITIENFLRYFSNREKIEIRKGQEIFILKNEKYKIEESYSLINTLTEVINFGIENQKYGFAFYISDNLKEGINFIILKFTFDKKIIFGVSIEANNIAANGKLVENFEKAIEIEKKIIELTNSEKTLIQLEYAPADDEEEFDEDIKLCGRKNE